MFTGIVTSIGIVRAAAPLSAGENAGDLRLLVASDLDLDSVAIGASIACSGVCLTVVEKGAEGFAVDVSAATRSVTAANRWAIGAPLNLERALKVGDELGGHIVTGHVDGVGTVMSVEDVGDSLRYLIAAPAALREGISVKGSIAIDGVSLTVNAVEDREDSCLFAVNVVPHTRAATAIAGEGEQVNLEIDIISRYLSRMMAIRHI